MDNCCKQKTTLSYCEKVNRTVPPSFCVACRGQWQKWRKENILDYRKKNLSSLTDEQKADTDLVSVIIPARECEKPYIQKTIDSVRENAVGSVEIIVICDGWRPRYLDYSCDTFCFGDEVIGQRAAVNDGIGFARGKYLFRLDAHCAMSEGWDARMKSSCGETDLVVPVYDHLDTETWQPTGRDTAFWYMGSDLHCRSVRPWKPIQTRMLEEDTMTFSGGAWMIRKDYYDELGGHDESLGKFGAVGPEWSLKVWLTGGRVLIRTDVVCAHLFREKSPYGYDWNEREKAFEKLHKMWVLGEDPRRKKPIEWLLYKFNDYVNSRPIASVVLK